MATARHAPAMTRPMHRSRFLRSPRTTASIVPRIGVISGATIIAPMTVAVESPTTPAAAMIDESVSSSQKRLSFWATPGSSKNTAPRRCGTSFIARPVTTRLWSPRVVRTRTRPCYVPGRRRSAAERPKTKGSPADAGTSGAQRSASSKRARLRVPPATAADDALLAAHVVEHLDEVEVAGLDATAHELAAACRSTRTGWRPARGGGRRRGRRCRRRAGAVPRRRRGRTRAGRR